MDTYDVIVIGAGPAGENAADRAHQGGLSVAIVEERLVGGECSYFACIPSKALLRPVHAARAAERVRVHGGRLEPAAVFERRDEFISGLDDAGQVAWVESAGLELLRGSARLTGVRRVEVGGRELTARHAVVLATGSRPAVPGIPGLRESRPWTNVEATTASKVPDSLVVLGGGAVACELGQAFAALGSRVTLVERADRLLGRTEDIAGTAVREALERDGVRVLTGAEATGVRREGDRVRVSLSDGESVEGDELLCALGRTPATAELGLDAVEVSTDERGFVPTDARMAVPTGDGESWLYAVGDVNGRALLTHMGKYQARCVGDLIAARATDPASAERLPVAWATDVGSPQVIFTDPEVAAVGLTSSEAVARGLRHRVVDVPMTSASGASLQADGYAGTARMIVDESRHVLLGATFVGQDVAEMGHAATIAVLGEIPLDRLWHAVPSFPTISEVWLRLLEAYRG